MRVALAGGLYFLAAFALGIVLGTLRVLLIGPQLGETTAVLLELPLMQGASWLLAAVIIRRLAIPPSPAERLTMGGTAFVLLMGAELRLGAYGFGRGLEQQLAQFTTLAGAMGLAGQVAFAFIPLLRGVRAARTP